MEKINEIEKGTCHECGYIGVLPFKYGEFKFCSPECHNEGMQNIKDLKGADKYDENIEL